MKERPILFSDEMVRAILDGRKTQTRRIVKPQPSSYTERILYEDGLFHPCDFPSQNGIAVPCEAAIKCPYGKVSDRLWVREAWANFAREYKANKAAVCYRASWPELSEKWKPSIHMRRAHSRINLEITNIRVQRVQDITEEDAEKEGAILRNCGHDYIQKIKSYRTGFVYLWQSIHEEPDRRWESNPWVWVIEFRRLNA